MPSQVIRWLHLSDFHVGKDSYAQRRMFEYIIGNVQKQKAEGFVPDFVCITGDLANKGLDSEYFDFWLEFVEPLQIEIGDGIAKRIFVVPGNHDVDRSINQAFSREEMSDAKGGYFDADEEGRKLREMLLPRFRGFHDNDQTTTKGAFESTKGSFAKVLDVRGRRVGIAGINTAWLCKDEFDERKLTPGKHLLEAALKDLATAELRIVLGHHPIDWLIREQQKSIKSLFGQNSVLYLHGHLHEAWAEPSNGGGYEFLAVQCGAAFQAREREKWRNGLVWAQANLDAREVRLQPWRWTADQQEWTLAADAFPEALRQDVWWVYPLPGSGLAKRLTFSVRPSSIQPPRGWSVSTVEDLNNNLSPLDEDAAVKFFDGAVPTWHTALSQSMPRRDIVGKLTESFSDADTANRPIVSLLLGAGCEGKTTAMLQTAYEVTRHTAEWRILRRVDDAETLMPALILPVFEKPFRWLVLLDEADRTAEALFKFLRQLPRHLQGRLHFLVACRDSDWQASGAYEFNWLSACTFFQTTLAGLAPAEAQSIVSAWVLSVAEG